MTYGITKTSKPASDKQRTFITDLASQRVTDAIKGDTTETIMNCLGEMFVTSAEASSAITDLLAQPKKIAGEKIVSSPSGGLLADLPCSKYAVELAGEDLVFLEVKEYKGTRYLRQLIGAPGDWKKIKPYGARRAQLADAIKLAGVKVAAKRYADEFTCCAACSSPLSDPLSRARGIGPDCWKRFS